MTGLSMHSTFPMELPMVLIREYDPTTDYPALRTCFIELQAWEQSFEPGLPAPEEVADPYLAEVFRNCAESSGRIFLAEANGVEQRFKRGRICKAVSLIHDRTQLTLRHLPQLADKRDFFV
jgi:hypothetical protein